MLWRTVLWGIGAGYSRMSMMTRTEMTLTCDWWPRWKGRSSHLSFLSISSNFKACLFPSATEILSYHSFWSQQVPKRQADVHKLREWAQLWLKKGYISQQNHDTGMRQLFSLWMQRWMNSPNSGCTLNLQTIPSNSNFFNWKILTTVFWYH